MRIRLDDLDCLLVRLSEEYESLQSMHIGIYT